jgi:hypothetical protein
MKKIIITLTEIDGEWSGEIYGKTDKLKTDKLKSYRQQQNPFLALAAVAGAGGMGKIIKWTEQIK